MTLTSDILNQTKLFREPELINEILEFGDVATFQNGDVIVRQGQYIKVLPIVLTGNIRVYQTKEDREILLYYVSPNQTCMMSLSACFFNHESPSKAVAMEESKILTIPTHLIALWQRKYSSWNDFVIKTFRYRYDELLESFKSVAFDHIDQRVIRYLEEKVSHQEHRTIQISHSQLAKELGTTRVVISRILKQYEIDNRLMLRRGEIELK